MGCTVGAVKCCRCPWTPMVLIEKKESGESQKVGKDTPSRGKAEME